MCMCSVMLFTFRRQLLALIRDHVATQGELIYLGLLPAQVKDPDLGICTSKNNNCKSFEVMSSQAHLME